MRCSVNRLLQLATKPRLQSMRSDTSSHVWPSANNKISRARRASSARLVRLLARRVSSVSSELVNLIASLMDAIIVYRWMLQSTRIMIQSGRDERRLCWVCQLPCHGKQHCRRGFSLGRVQHTAQFHSCFRLSVDATAPVSPSERRLGSLALRCSAWALEVNFPAGQPIANSEDLPTLVSDFSDPCGSRTGRQLDEASEETAVRPQMCEEQLAHSKCNRNVSD